jgi:hypothetical protein
LVDRALRDGPLRPDATAKDIGFTIIASAAHSPSVSSPPTNEHSHIARRHLSRRAHGRRLPTLELTTFHRTAPSIEKRRNRSSESPSNLHGGSTTRISCQQRAADHCRPHASSALGDMSIDEPGPMRISSAHVSGVEVTEISVTEFALWPPHAIATAAVPAAPTATTSEMDSTRSRVVCSVRAPGLTVDVSMMIAPSVRRSGSLGPPLAPWVRVVAARLPGTGVDRKAVAVPPRLFAGERGHISGRAANHQLNGHARVEISLQSS